MNNKMSFHFFKSTYFNAQLKHFEFRTLLYLAI